MTRVFFKNELESVAVFWRLARKDGVMLGFTSHDQDLEFDGLIYRAAPGMLPSAIRRTASLELDNAEVTGILSHDAITAKDLSAGRYDGAGFVVGLVDWNSLEWSGLYHGKIGDVSTDSGAFEAELKSAKGSLENDLVPRTSPTCRAKFCGPGCNLSANRFTHMAIVTEFDEANARVKFDGVPPATDLYNGFVRWLDGPDVGITMHILDAGAQGILLDQDIAPDLEIGIRAIIREGCDRTIGTCSTRFKNAVNFQGEPFLPGNDALLRYPTSQL